VDVKAKRLNAAFVEMTKTAQEAETVREMTQTFLREKIREDSFFRMILPPRIVTRAECTRSVNHRSLVKIIDIEPDVPAAVPVDFRGNTEAVYVTGERYEVPFMEIMSREFQMKQYELLSYEMPITEILRENTEKEIAKAEDKGFMNAVEAALAVTGHVVTRTKEAGQTVDKKDLAALFKIHDSVQLKTSIVLIPLPLYEDILAWDFSLLGNELIKEVTIGGYNYPTLMGRTVIVTNKLDIVSPNTIYGFTTQEYLGHSFLLEEDLVFDMVKEFDLYRFKAWELIGAGIGNVKAVSKLVLTNA